MGLANSFCFVLFVELLSNSSAYIHVLRHQARVSCRGTKLCVQTQSTKFKSDNFPDERYRKNRLLYTQLKEESPLILSPSSQRALEKPKILSPAGGWQQLEAAVSAGADAVYFGCNAGLNARARAANFELHELGDVMTYLHERGLDGYMCMNVLVFDSELSEAEMIVREAARAGVDALIVQDLGLASLVRRVAPSLPIHASTQMSVSDGHGAVFAASKLGCETVVVGRELSISDIAAVVDTLRSEVVVSGGDGEEDAANEMAVVGTKGAEPQRSEGEATFRGEGVRVEAFVHGAMCVSYSGQCFSSEAWGGRSANRGQCAQACRMPYGLVVNGELTELVDSEEFFRPGVRGSGSQRLRPVSGAGEEGGGGAQGLAAAAQYVLSPQDLCGLDRVEELIAAGVDTFKIEGRLKGPEFVYTTTRAYRERIDSAWAAMHQQHQQQHDHGVAAGEGTSAALEASPPARDTAASSSASSSSSGSQARAEGSAWVPSRDELKQFFARGQDEAFDGLTTGFLDGPQHQNVVRGRAPKHRGLLSGRVLKVVRMPAAQRKAKKAAANGKANARQQPGLGQSPNARTPRGGGGGTEYGVMVQLSRPLKRGDGVVFDSGSPDREELGGSVFGIFPAATDLDKKGGVGKGGEVEATEAGMTVVLTFNRGVTSKLHHAYSRQQQQKYHHQHHRETASSSFSLSPGDLIWRTHDAALSRKVSSAVADLTLAKSRCPVRVSVSCDGLGSPLVVKVHEVRDGSGNGRGGGSGSGDGGAGLVGQGSTLSMLQPLENAEGGRALSRASLSKAIGQLGDTPFSLVDDAAEAEPELLLLNPSLDALLDQEAGAGGGGGGASSAAAGVFMPLSEIKAARRAAVAQLLEQRAHRHSSRAAPEEGSVSLAPSLVKSAVQGVAAAAAAAGEIADTDVESESDRGQQQQQQQQQRVEGKAYSLSVLCRNMEQVEAAVTVERVTEVAVDFLEAKGVSAALAKIKAAGKRAVAVSPRIIKPDEEGLWRWLLDLHPDAILVRSAGLLEQLSAERKRRGVAASGEAWPDLYGDFSLNAANALSASFLLNGGGGIPGDEWTETTNSQSRESSGERGGGGGGGGERDGSSSSHSAQLSLNSLAPTHDLNARQLCHLQRELGASESAPLEAIIHTHLPIFHTEHCVFCRFLSQGSSFRDCGHPCESNTLHLRGVDVRAPSSVDASSATPTSSSSSPACAEDHLVLADMGCRNTVFNAKAQSAAAHLLPLARAGFRRFRVELVDEPSDWVAPLVQVYADLLDSAVLGEAAAVATTTTTAAPSPQRNNNHNGSSASFSAAASSAPPTVLGGGSTQGGDSSAYAAQVADALAWLERVPDANGRVHGVGEGSLKDSEERKWTSLRPTAATKNAAAGAGGAKKRTVKPR